MIQTRDAHTDDEAWMIERLNKADEDIDNFNPREFLLAIDDVTEERLAFGRTEYVRNVDDTEYVEINSVFILDRADKDSGERLIADLVGNLNRDNQNQVFAFPSDLKDVFETVGFNEIDQSNLPTVMKDRYEDEVDRHGDSVTPMMALPSNVEVEDEDEDEDEFSKPNEVSPEEVEKIKDELDIDDSDTKYSV